MLRPQPRLPIQIGRVPAVARRQESSFQGKKRLPKIAVSSHVPFPVGMPADDLEIWGHISVPTTILLPTSSNRPKLQKFCRIGQKPIDCTRKSRPS
jgi:hypothetical protein